MGSTVSACLGEHFKNQGVNYSITSACSTSGRTVLVMHGINPLWQGKTLFLLQAAKKKAGAQTCMFDAMGLYL